MNYMIKRALLCIGVLGLILHAYGQELPDRAIGMPEHFDRPFLDLETEISEVQYSRPWKVYSDRNENKSYTSPEGTVVNSNIGFMQRFYVAEREGDYLHIYKDPLRPNFPGISSSAECSAGSQYKAAKPIGSPRSSFFCGFGR